MTPRILEVRRGVLKKNDELAAGLRERFRAAGTFAVNIASSPGAGKTRLLEQTLALLQSDGLRVSALVGDPETDNDAVRLARSGAPVCQIRTRGVCHLDAAMVGEHLESLPVSEYLFIENVGNLVCTASFDLGEALRVVLLAVTEGEDKPLKYPGIFNSADVAMISKCDLAAACQFERDVALANLHMVRPGLRVLETSGKTGAGIRDWLTYLQKERERFLQEA